MNKRISISKFHILIFVSLQCIVTFGAYVSSTTSYQLYVYNLLACQFFGYCYIYVLRNGQRAYLNQGQFFARIFFRTLSFTLVFGMILGVINFIDGRNEFFLTLTYFVLSIFQLIIFYAGYKCAVYNHWFRMRKILIVSAIMESMHGIARYLGDVSGLRNSIGLSREGFWTLFYGYRFLFLFVIAGVLFVAATSGMRMAIVTIAFYLTLLFLSSEKVRHKVRRRLVVMFLVAAVLGPIGVATLLSMDRDIFPRMVQVTLNRLELTLNSTADTKIEDGRDLEWRSVEMEIKQNGNVFDSMFGRGVGFTYFNERTKRRDTHVHLAVPRIFSRYGYFGIVVFFGSVLFVLYSSFVEAIVLGRLDIVKLGFLHSFLYFLFFGEDVFMSFWFLFGAALGSCFNSHFGASRTRA